MLQTVLLESILAFQYVTLTFLIIAFSFNKSFLPFGFMHDAPHLQQLQQINNTPLSKIKIKVGK